MTILRKLLKSNPGDNIGARFDILAIHLGLKHDYEKKFACGDMSGYLDAFKVCRWFDKHSKKFPEEFGWWFKAMQEEK